MSRPHSGVLAAGVALALFPLLDSPFYTDLVAKIMILAIFAMSLDLLVGYTGLVSFGHAAWFGLGAYSLALVTPQAAAASLWLTLPLAVLTAAACAFIVGLFVLRTRGIYFIMVTLAFAQMFYFLFHDTKLGGGSDGRYINVRPEAAIGATNLLDLGNVHVMYYTAFASMLLVLAFLKRLADSPFGRALQGIRGNEQRMRTLGYPVFRYKLACFTLAGAIGGFAGYLSAVQYGFVNPEIFSWHQSGNVLLMIILGGMGNLYGAIAGAFAFVLLQELFSSWTKHWQLPLGIVIVCLVLFLPGGLAGAIGRMRAALARRAAERTP